MQPRAQYSALRRPVTWSRPRTSRRSTDLDPLFAAGNHRSEPDYRQSWKIRDLFMRRAIGQHSAQPSGYPATPASSAPCTRRPQPGTTTVPILARCFRQAWTAKPILDAEWASAAAPGANIEVAALQGHRHHLWWPDRACRTCSMPAAAPAIISHQLRRVRGRPTAPQPTLLSIPSTSRLRRKASPCSSPRGMKARPACDAKATSATHGIGVSGFASTPYNVAVGGTDFGDTYAAQRRQPTGVATEYRDLRLGPLVRAGDPLERLLRRAHCSRPRPATRTPYGTSGFCNSSTGAQQLTTGVRAAAARAAAPPGLPRPAGSSAAAATATRSQRGSRSSPASRTTACAICPTCRCSPPTACGGTTMCFATPTRATSFMWRDPLHLRRQADGLGGGGTSFASPILAGIQALVNQAAGGPQGNPNPVYYTFAARQAASGSPATPAMATRSPPAACSTT